MRTTQSHTYETLFNPILHESEEAVILSEAEGDDDCQCDSQDPADFYTGQKICKSCVIRNVVSVRKGITPPKRKRHINSACDCGATGAENFYKRPDGKYQYPCKACKKKRREEKAIINNQSPIINPK